MHRSDSAPPVPDDVSEAPAYEEGPAQLSRDRLLRSGGKLVSAEVEHQVHNTWQKLNCAVAIPHAIVHSHRSVSILSLLSTLSTVVTSV